MSDLKNLILEKVFRKQENWKKVEFILSATHLDMSILVKASTVACANEFHNFGHQIGATESFINIAREAGLTQEEIDMIALIILFHDASHRGIVQRYDEMRAFDAMSLVISEKDTRNIPIPFETIMDKGRDLIIATTFSNRGKIVSLHERLVQDADLAHLGQGPIYWMWASMGLVDEFARQEGKPLSPVTFIRERQEKFVKFLNVVGGGHPFLTDAAKRIFRNPVEDVQTVINFTDEQINYAYAVRREDLTLEEFSRRFEERG